MKPPLVLQEGQVTQKMDVGVLKDLQALVAIYYSQVGFAYQCLCMSNCTVMKHSSPNCTRAKEIKRTWVQ